MARVWCGVGAVSLLAAAPALAHAQASSGVSGIVVVGTTPLAGAEADPATVAAPVQTATAAQIAQSNALDLTAYMTRNLAGVYVNDVQNNPLQPDVNYRGYTASPLLGTAQGLSLYMDGVRLNQPFGDVVSWDLIPAAAIDSITLTPGSDPLFGLNTLGGALSIKTKDGRTSPGTSLQGAYGSYGRWQIQGETGGKSDNGFNWYGTANRFEDRGWREASPSKATQAFGKLGWSGADTDIAASGSYADTNLTGNGLQEQRLLAADYRSVYTKPDNTRNKAGLFNLTAKHRFSEHVSFSGAAFYRSILTRTINGDLSDDSIGESVYQPSAAEQAALRAAGYTGFPTSGETSANTPFPKWRCIANALLDSEPNEKCNAVLNHTATDQQEGGASGQFTWTGDLGGRGNQLTAGGGYSQSHVRFAQGAQFGYLSPDRGVITVGGPGAFADGSQDSENAFDARVDLSGRTEVHSLYVTDTMEVAPRLHLTLSGRYDDTNVKTIDAITPTGPGSLTGDHRYSRFNPSVGLTFNPSSAWGAYAGYTEGSRAPSAIEIGCADPANPCRLPNAMAGDPPLKQVVARTIDLGLRGHAGAFNWHAGAWRAENADDIMFVADNAAGFGYFKNFGKTRRQGVELGLDGRQGPVSFGASYTYLDATYQSTEVIGGTGNSTNNIAPGFEGTITVRPGNHIPLVPSSLFKANARWDVTPKLGLDADVLASGGVYARGDENNLHQPDGVYYFGPGKTKGYAVLNLGGDYRPTRRLKLFVEISNLFDTRYANAAQLGATGFTPNGNFLARPFSGPIVGGERPVPGATFYAPGAPRMAWGGVKYSF